MDKSRSILKLFPLRLAILLLTFIIILFQHGASPLFEVQYALGTDYDRTFPAGQPVNINASKTSSSAGGQINFTWTQINGPPVFGDNKILKGPVLSFKPPVSRVPQSFEFKLVASQGQVTESENINVFVKGDQPPRAETGNSNIINAQDICGENTSSLSSSSPQIILDGRNSNDTEGGPLKYNWTQINGPPVTISDPTNITASVKSDSICGLTQTSYLEFRLVVTDSAGQTASKNLTIPVQVNQSPIARINAPDKVQPGQNLTLDASASSDADGSIIEYSWSFRVNNGPISEENIRKSPIVNFASSNFPADSTLQFQLRVKDDDDAYSKLAEKTIKLIPNYPPVANAGNDRVINKGDLCSADTESEYLFGVPPKVNNITLDAINSTDREGGPLRYSWSQVGGPLGQLSSQGNGTAFFAYDFCVLTQPTDFKYKLDVTDNVGQIDSKNLTITVVGFQSTDPSSNEGFQSIDPSSNEGFQSIDPSSNEGFQSIDPNTDSGIQNDNLYSR